MNEQWILLQAQEHRRELLEEAQQARLLKEAGIRENVPGALKALGVVLLGLPFALILVRAWFKL